MRKITLPLICLGLICALNFTTALESADVPSPPMPGVFWGTAILDGANVSAGDVVTAYDSDDVSCGNFTVNTDGYYGYFGVKGDNLNTTLVDEGAIEGDTITFYVNGVEAGSGVWNEGEIKRVDLHIACGDVNCDGEINMADVMTLWYYVGYPGSYTLCNEWFGDVNCDGEINMADVMTLWYYVGYPGSYTLSCCSL